MIVHQYLNASDNLAQYAADQIDRQEVTVDWYLEHMIDACVFRWMDDEAQEMGMDPWRFYMDLPIEPEEVKERGWRLFVQRKDMPPEIRTVKHDPFPRHRFQRYSDARTESELMEAADQRWNSQ